MSLEFYGTINDVGNAFYKIGSMTELDVAKQIWAATQCPRDTPVESLLRDAPFWGSKSPMHHNELQPVWHKQRHKLWNLTLTGGDSIGYHPACPFGEYSVPAMVMQLKCLETGDFCGVNVTHIDPNITDIGGLGSIIYGQHENAITPMVPFERTGRCIVGLGIESMLRAWNDFDGDWGGVLLNEDAFASIKGITPKNAEHVTIAASGLEHEDKVGQALGDQLTREGVPWNRVSYEKSSLNLNQKMPATSTGLGRNNE